MTLTWMGVEVYVLRWIVVLGLFGYLLGSFSFMGRFQRRGNVIFKPRENNGPDENDEGAFELGLQREMNLFEIGSERSEGWGKLGCDL